MDSPRDPIANDVILDYASPRKESKAQFDWLRLIVWALFVVAVAAILYFMLPELAYA